MSILLLIILVVLGVGLAAYIVSCPDVPYWLKQLLNIALALVVVIGIAAAIFTIMAIMAHI